MSDPHPHKGETKSTPAIDRKSLFPTVEDYSVRHRQSVFHEDDKEHDLHRLHGPVSPHSCRHLLTLLDRIVARSASFRPIRIYLACCLSHFHLAVVVPWSRHLRNPEHPSVRGPIAVPAITRVRSSTCHLHLWPPTHALLCFLPYFYASHVALIQSCAEMQKSDFPLPLVPVLYGQSHFAIRKALCSTRELHTDCATPDST